MSAPHHEIAAGSALHTQAAQWPSVNNQAAPLVAALLREQQALRLGVTRGPQGHTIVDAGIAYAGGLEAGRRVAEICMGGLGTVRLWSSAARWPLQVSVYSSNPVLACLGSQYAGWSLSHGTGKGAFHALGSGPARALACKEDLFADLGYRDQADSTCLVLEVDKPPPQEVVEKVMRDCKVDGDKLTFVLTPTRSLAGVVQIVARVLEVAVHKVHTLGFPLQHVVDGGGSAPLPPPCKDFIEAMGRTNDAILFGGEVQLFVSCSDSDARELAHKLPCSASRDYGKRFAQIFKDYAYDFYKIDPMLFAPAQVVVSCLESGNSFRAGKLNADLLDVSFGGPGG